LESLKKNDFSSPPPIPIEEGEIEKEKIWAGLTPQQRSIAEDVKTTMEYILEPYVPEGLKKEFEKYEFLISKNVALGNIPRDWIPRYLTYFDVITLWLKSGEFEVAVKRMARLAMELQLTRAVEGFERMAEITTKSVVEETPKPEIKKRRFLP